MRQQSNETLAFVDRALDTGRAEKRAGERDREGQMKERGEAEGS